MKIKEYNSFEFLKFVQSFKKDPCRAFDALPGYDVNDSPDLVVFNNPVHRVIFINNPDVAADVLVSPQAEKFTFMERFMPVSGSTVAANGDVWHERKMRLAPAFAGRNLHANIPSLETIAQETAAAMHADPTCDIGAAISQYQVQFTSRLIFHEKLEPATLKELTEAITYLFEYAYKGTGSITSIVARTENKIAFSPDPKIRRYGQVLRQFADELCEHKMAEGLSGDDFLSRALKGAGGADIPEDKRCDIARAALGMLFASVINSTAGTYAVLKKLSDDPEFQRTLAASEEAPPEMKRFIAETFRVSPPQSLQFPREMKGTYALDEDFTFKKGDLLTISMPNLGRQPRFFTNPEQFNPDRFIPKEQGGEGAPDLSFSVGMRKCPAQGVSTQSIYLLARSLARQGIFQLPEAPEESQYRFSRRPVKDSTISFTGR